MLNVESKEWLQNFDDLIESLVYLPKTRIHRNKLNFKKRHIEVEDDQQDNVTVSKKDVESMKVQMAE